MISPYLVLLGFINERDKRYYIVRSHSTEGSIERLMKYPVMLADKDNITTKIIETIDDEQHINCRLEYWCDQYSALGYTWYAVTSYKPRGSIIEVNVMEDYTVQVKVTYCGSGGFVVGIFDTVLEARSFVEKCYPVNKCYNVVYALNEATRDYVKNEVMKLQNY